MSKWTEAELAALRASGRDYHKFGRRTGYSKSYDAWEVKSRRVKFAEPPPSFLARLRALIHR